MALHCSVPPEPIKLIGSARTNQFGSARTNQFHLSNQMSMLLFFSQDGENGSDSGYPSERRSEGDPNDHVDGVKIDPSASLDSAVRGKTVSKNEIHSIQQSTVNYQCFFYCNK